MMAGVFDIVTGKIEFGDAALMSLTGIGLVFLVLAFLAWRRRDFFFTGTAGWRRRAGAVAECLLYAGILGNLVDRVFRGFVIDFLDFHWGPHHFPCFNVADICISVAAGLLVLASFGAPSGKPGAKS